jgi:5'(3')-deoxyribonucleotidase
MTTPSKTEINVFLDSDGPVADFDEALEKSGMHTDDFKMLPGIYLWLNVTPGAAEAIKELWALDQADLLRLWVLTKTPTNSPYAYTEKVLWYRQHFPFLEDRVILTHDKSLLGTEGDFLTDDRPHKANARLFRGTLHVFDVSRAEHSWRDFVELVKRSLPK